MQEYLDTVLCQSVIAKYTLNTREYFRLLPTCSCILVKLKRATNTLYELYSHKYGVRIAATNTALIVATNAMPGDLIPQGIKSSFDLVPHTGCQIMGGTKSQ